MVEMRKHKYKCIRNWCAGTVGHIYEFSHNGSNGEKDDPYYDVYIDTQGGKSITDTIISECMSNKENPGYKIVE